MSGQSPCQGQRVFEQTPTESHMVAWGRTNRCPQAVTIGMSQAVRLPAHCVSSGAAAREDDGVGYSPDRHSRRREQEKPSRIAVVGERVHRQGVSGSRFMRGPGRAAVHTR